MEVFVVGLAGCAVTLSSSSSRIANRSTVCLVLLVSGGTMIIGD